MEISINSIIGNMVAKDYRMASVFQSYGIDYCCNGNRTIREVCNERNIEPELLIENLNKITGENGTRKTDYNSWPLDLLADYIEKTHHRYVESKIQEIKPLLQKIVSVHGQQHPELKKVEKLFCESADELTVHMKKEELMLFPFIRKIAQHPNEKLTAPFGSVKNPIAMMHQEHNLEGERFRQISSLTNNYTPPADACNTYRVTFALLKEFEEDLHLHIHLENNILFPKSMEMESALA